MRSMVEGDVLRRDDDVAGRPPSTIHMRGRPPSRAGEEFSGINC